ncbi:transposase family protein [Streptomyces sp. KLMMK]|uniref:transposase family protein n=1 Tax=Streptomyces sp. KLMMK TaxID=3109353 RepID=UPI003FA7BB46
MLRPRSLAVPCPSWFDVPDEFVGRDSWLVHARRRVAGNKWRRPGCCKALLALAYLWKNETYRQVGAGFGVSESIAWRYAAMLAVSSRPGHPVSVKLWWVWGSAISSFLNWASPSIRRFHFAFW